MKTSVYFLLLVPFLFLFSTGKGQCPPGGITFSSQAEIDAFATNYPNCTETGYLFISGSTITDLSPLSNLTSIGGYLNIYNNSNLTNLDGLSNLTSIGGFLDIYNNSNLTNLDGLSNLTSVGGSLYISNNSNLTNLDGLSNLTSVEKYLYIYSNSNLTNLDGLSNLTSIGGDLLIDSNYALTDISGLQNIDPTSILSTYGIGLHIVGNTSLSVCNLDNFCTYLQGSGLRTIFGNAGDCVSEAAVTTACIPCDAPEDLGVENIQNNTAKLIWEAEGDLFEIEWGEAGFSSGSGTMITNIEENQYELIGLQGGTAYEFYVRTDCGGFNQSDWTGPYGFTTLNCPTGDFTFTTQQEIDNFGTMYSSCTGIVLNSLHIGPDFGNPTDITDLTPLQNIKSVNGNVTIQYNSSLANLSGLENLTEIGGNLKIYNNPVLTSIDELSSLADITGELYIGYNEGLTEINGFNSLESVGKLTVSSNNLNNIQGFQNLNQIHGDLNFFSGMMVNCPSFESLEHITGELMFQYSYVVDLSGFNALQSVGGFLISYANLTEVSGLNALQSINGQIKIVGTNISNLDFLHNITTISGELTIGGNNNLDDISGLQNIHHNSIQYLSFIENGNLSVCNLPNLCTYLSNPANPRTLYGNAGNCYDEATVTAACAPCTAPEDLAVENIQNNAAKLIWEADGDSFEIEWGEAGFTQGSGTTITDIEENHYELSGLQGETAYEFYVRTDCGGFNQSDWAGPFSYTTLPTCPVDDLYLFSQADIDSFASIYPNCVSISGNVIINGTDINNLTGLSSIETIGGMLYIYNNPQLETLSALSNLTSVGDGVSVFLNPLLENLNGLNSLTTIGGTLSINSNDNLTDISDMENIDASTIQNLYIVNNPNLSVCNLPNFCTYLSNPDNLRTISDNAGDCISDLTVMNACDLSGNCDIYTIWDGLTWSNGEPDVETRAIIDGNLTLTENLSACELLLNSGVLRVSSGVTLTVNGRIENTQSEANFIVENDANLIQIEDVANSGAINLQRNSSPMMRLDYALWSSPVDGQGIHAFSPQTVASRIYTYEGQDGYQVVGDLSADFKAGKGYMFRAPNNWNQTTDSNEGNPVAYPGEFIGIPFNGDISIDIHSMNYTSVGNPYPSNIRLGDNLMHTGNDTFLNANPEVSTIYFWTNTYDANGNGGYVGNNWATYTFMGGTSAGLGAGSQTPSPYVAPGQGFIIRSVGSATSINFNNSMRVSNPALFFKGAEEGSHRFWLNLKGVNSENHNQILIGYMEGATHDADHQIDGKMFGYEGPAIYNRIEEEAFVIQGRPLPFESSDVVPLGFKTETANKYIISLSQYEGLFAQGLVTIYLKDNLLGLTHNLLESDYEFESLAGEFKERFEVVYKEASTMGTSDLYTNFLQIYPDQEYIVVNSQKEEILLVELYDLSGKNLFKNEKVNSKYYRFKSDHLGTQILIVKVQTANGDVTTKKLIN